MCYIQLLHLNNMVLLLFFYIYRRHYSNTIIWFYHNKFINNVIVNYSINYSYYVFNNKSMQLSYPAEPIGFEGDPLNVVIPIYIYLFFLYYNYYNYFTLIINIYQNAIFNAEVFLRYSNVMFST